MRLRSTFAGMPGNDGTIRHLKRIDKVTVFSVNVTNAKADSIKAGVNSSLNIKELVFSDKSLKILLLCKLESHTKKEMLQMIGVTNQTANVRSIIKPLIQAGCLAPVEEDRLSLRNVRYEATECGLEYLRYRQSLQTEWNSELSLSPELD